MNDRKGAKGGRGVSLVSDDVHGGLTLGDTLAVTTSNTTTSDQHDKQPTGKNRSYLGMTHYTHYLAASSMTCATSNTLAAFLGAR